MKRLLFIAFAIIALQSCNAPQADYYDKIEYREYEILSINPPKHFSIDLKDVLTEKVYKDAYRTKHCSGHTKLKIGQHIWMKRGTTTYGGRETTDFIDPHDCLCK